MSFGRYLTGLLLVAVCLVPLALGAYALRRRLLESWTGAPARLAECVIGVTALILALQLLGLVSLLHPVPVALGCVVAGALMWRAGTSGAPVASTAPPAPPQWGGRAASLAALSAGALVVGAWCTRVLPALNHGMTGADTVWYHLPQAVRFVQDGSITHVQFFETGAGTAFYPATSGLFHALGMLWFGNDFLSPFLNLAWLGLLLLAAYCAGRRRGLGPISVLAVTLVFATPIMVETQPGGAYNDVVGLALLLSAAALLVNGGPTGITGTLAALAAAGALGTKLSMTVPLGALAVGAVAVAPRGKRLRMAGVWLAALLAMGGVWFVRNLIAFGNPIPAADIQLGPVELHSPPLTKLTYTVAHYIGQPGVWGDHFQPGLLEAWGPVWWAIAGLALIGMIGAVVGGRSRVERMLGVVAIVSAVAFVFTPQGLGTEADPQFFKFNLRYPTPALVLGLALLPLVPRPDARRVLQLLTGVLAAVLVVTQLDPAVWPTGLRSARFADAPGHGTALAAAALGAAVLAAGVLLIARPRARVGGAPGPLRALALVAVLALVPAGYLVQRNYLRDRYADWGPMPSVARWARDVDHSRIAIVNFFIQYPLTGLDGSNRVDYVAKHGPHGTFTPFRTCAGWRRALNNGHYRYVVTTPFNYPGNVTRAAPPEEIWTRSDPKVTPLLRDNQVVALFRIDGPLDPGACSA